MHTHASIGPEAVVSRVAMNRSLLPLMRNVTRIPVSVTSAAITEIAQSPLEPRDRSKPEVNQEACAVL